MARSPLMSFLHAAAGDGVPDAELLRRFASDRDEAAFELLVRRHAELVWGVCRATAGGHHAAEDAFQATFLALSRRPTIRANVAGWLHRVARHAALRARKANDRRERIGEAPEADRSPDHELAEVLHAELDRLPDKYRLPVVLCDLDGLTHTAAAARLGWPVGSVSGRLVRARDLLKSRLLRKGIAPAAGLIAVIPVDAALIRYTASAAVGVPPPAAVALAEGVLSAMRFAKLKLLAAGVTVTVGLAGMGTLFVGAAPQEKPAADPKPAAVVKKPTADAKQRARSIDSLRKILLAFHSYHDTFQRLPDDIRANDGTPILSWRVALLPFLEQENVYRAFDLEQPWDSPANRAAATVRVTPYSTGRESTADPYPLTFFQRPKGKLTGFESGAGLKFTDITDGLSNTVGVVEHETAVPWAKPGDFTYDVTKPADVFGPFVNVFHFGMFDGSVRTAAGGLPKAASVAFTRAGEEVFHDGILNGTGLPPGVTVPPDDLAALRKEVADGTADLDRLLADNHRRRTEQLAEDRRRRMEKLKRDIERAEKAGGDGLAKLLLDLDRLRAEARRENEALARPPAPAKK